MAPSTRRRRESRTGELLEILDMVQAWAAGAVRDDADRLATGGDA